MEPHRLDAEIRPSNRSDFTGQAVTIAHLDAASLPEDSFLTRLCPQNRAVVMACSVEADWSDVIRSVNVLRPLCTGGRDVSGTVWPPPTLDLGVHIVTSDQPVFSLDNRALFVVAGLPGAGKSTLLRNIVVDPKVTLLDTDQMRSKLGTFFPAGTPYSYYRPLVHVLHTLRLVATAMRAPARWWCTTRPPARSPERRSSCSVSSPVAAGICCGSTAQHTKRWPASITVVGSCPAGRSPGTCAMRPGSAAACSPPPSPQAGTA